MAKIKPIKFLIPAIFLFVLGIGNIAVGSLKQAQFIQAYNELAELAPIEKDMEASALNRIQNIKQTKERHIERKLQAKERKHFYGLVAYGGKVFVGLSLVFFYLSFFSKYLLGNKNDSVLSSQ